MTRRLERVAKRIQQELGSLVPQLRHPEIGFITITKVEPSPDLRVAKVYVSVLPTRGHDDPKASLNALKHSSGFLQSNLGKIMRSKVTPELRFYLDESVARSAQMSELLTQARSTDADHVHDEADETDGEEA
ncbi:MAG: 30S ribosome-binding factor RbfA [Planctomycetota bacterium]|jgi:ribosome-binding factor A